MGATYFKNALSASRETLDVDWDALEEAWETNLPKRQEVKLSNDQAPGTLPEAVAVETIESVVSNMTGPTKLPTIR